MRCLTRQLILCFLLAACCFSNGAAAQLFGNSAIINVGSGGTVLVQSAAGNPPRFVCAENQSCRVDNFADGDLQLSARPRAGFAFNRWQVETGGILTAPRATNISIALSASNNGPAEVTATFSALDSDEDGVADPLDLCPGTPLGAAVDSNGCAPSQLDDDGDGVGNAVDACPNTPPGASVDSTGCASSQLDDDSDGVANDVDACPNTPPGASVDNTGCAPSQLDDDGDGVANDVDACPNTPPGVSVDGTGCASTQLDGDGDGVDNSLDECPNTAPGAAVDADGCAASQLDDDDDGVSSDVDACPNTPPGASVDATGCAPSQLDDDGDGVANDVDACPNTRPGVSADSTGCAPSQRDDDDDGVGNDLDACPSTPPGAGVDATGCAPSQLDDDDDGVADDVDACPSTPPGAGVDGSGCAPSQLDDDGDGVTNDADECPATPAGAGVDRDGCAPSQLDDDGDGVNNDIDQCPATPPGAGVDGNGCAESQLDDDGDGVSNDVDACPGSDPALPTDGAGCSEVQNFGDELAMLSGLSAPQRRLAGRIDEICPRLVVDSVAGADLGASQRRLREACSRLKNRETNDEQALLALERILPTQVSAFRDYAVELATVQFRQLDSRRRLVSRGRGRGISVSGLTLRSGDQVVSGDTVQRAVGDLLGMAAGEGDRPFADFGRLGLFLQGDIDFADRDSDPDFARYNFDIRSITAGADYRFSERFFAGVAVGAGAADIQYGAELGKTEIDNMSISVYGGLQLTDAWFADLLVSYGESDYDNERQIAYSDSGGAYNATHLSSTGGDQLYLGLNTGYQWETRGWRFGPTASIFYVDARVDGFEEGAQAGSDDAWTFAVGGQDFESLRLSLGLQVDYAITTGFGVLAPNLRASYVHETEESSADVGLRLLNNPYAQSDLLSDALGVMGRPVDDAFLDLGVGLSGQFPMGFSGFIDYHRYESFDGFSRDGYSFGLRWDKPF